VDAIDIVMVTHDRPDFLVATVDALFERTPEPFRLTIVDNASGTAVRNWLAANRDRLARVIALPENEHVAAFQHGIDATTSDPYVLADPDLVVPDLQPSWLARLRDLLDRHSDYGLIGLGLVGHTGGGEIVEGNVGTWFQMIRRDALREPYVKDSLACQAVRDRGYRVGWTPKLLADHLGHGDPVLYPGHVAEKNAVVSRLVERNELSPYPFYHRELEAIPRPPSLLELAVAAPVVAEIRAAEIPLASVLELSWTAPAVAAVYDEAVAVQSPPPGRVPLADGAAGAVVLLEPPSASLHEALGEAFRLAAKLVVLVCDLEAVGGRLADELAPEGWSGREQPTVGEVGLELARAGDELPALADAERFMTIQHREDWLSLFAVGAFGRGRRRLFVFEKALEVPERVQDEERLPRWRPEDEPEPPPSRPARFRRRARGLAARLRAAL
jgi:hypothetical protein